jgi:hypothetical protein
LRANYYIQKVHINGILVQEHEATWTLFKRLYIFRRLLTAEHFGGATAL